MKATSRRSLGSVKIKKVELETKATAGDATKDLQKQFAEGKLNLTLFEQQADNVWNFTPLFCELPSAAGCYF